MLTRSPRGGKAPYETGDENPGGGPEVSTKKSTHERSMEIMLKLMQGMQTMQQQILEQQGAGRRAASEERRED